MTLQDMKKGQERLRLNRDEANRRPTITRSGACIEHPATAEEGRTRQPVVVCFRPRRTGEKRV